MEATGGTGARPWLELELELETETETETETEREREREKRIERRKNDETDRNVTFCSSCESWFLRPL